MLVDDLSPALWYGARVQFHLNGFLSLREIIVVHRNLIPLPVSSLLDP